MKKYCWNQSGPDAEAATSSQGAGGVGAEYHDGAHRAGGFDRGNFRLGMGRAVVAGGIEHDREGDFLAQYSGSQGTVFDVHHHAGAQHDRIEHGAGAADGDLVGGSAGDEIVVSLLDALLRDLFVLENIDGFSGHCDHLEAGLESGKGCGSPLYDEPSGNEIATLRSQ